MPPPENDNGWERWRGEVSQMLKSIEEQGDRLCGAFETHVKDDQQNFDAIKTKLTKGGAIGGVAIIVLGWVVPEVVKHFLTGG